MYLKIFIICFFVILICAGPYTHHANILNTRSAVSNVDEGFRGLTIYGNPFKNGKDLENTYEEEWYCQGSEFERATTTIYGPILLQITESFKIPIRTSKLEIVCSRID